MLVNWLNACFVTCLFAASEPATLLQFAIPSLSTPLDLLMFQFKYSPTGDEDELDELLGNFGGRQRKKKPKPGIDDSFIQVCARAEEQCSSRCGLL